MEYDVKQREGMRVADKKAPPREVSPYDPSAVARIIKVITSETGLARRGDLYDLSQPARRADSIVQRAKE